MKDSCLLADHGKFVTPPYTIWESNAGYRYVVNVVFYASLAVHFMDFDTSAAEWAGVGSKQVFLGQVDP